jgi:hypothetical protein
MKTVEKPLRTASQSTESDGEKPVPSYRKHKRAGQDERDLRRPLNDLADGRRLDGKRLTALVASDRHTEVLFSNLTGCDAVGAMSTNRHWKSPQKKERRNQGRSQSTDPARRSLAGARSKYRFCTSGAFRLRLIVFWEAVLDARASFGLFIVAGTRPHILGPLSFSNTLDTATACERPA